ncbi:MAG: biotin--[acetyl-CoA-carboxylase] ligase [Acidobacteriia bacterium]|nr:biotin--[acetyl-CoA-carboxylase] ligase [Terriglobia bacterium]
MDEVTVRKIDKLLNLLADHATLVVSGEKIARELGVSRSSVWNWIEKLRALGCEIEGVQTTGYRLKKLPDLLSPQLVRRELANSNFGKTIHHFFEIDSTNKYAVKLAMEEAAEGTVILAEEQTAGLGRLGRAWYSEPLKGIYCTVILRPSLPPAKAPLINLAAALAVHDAVQRINPLKMDIRWPNDLIADGKKFCGILAEMNQELGRIHWVTLGFGINVNHTKFPAELAEIATSLRLVTGKNWSRLELTGQILKALESSIRSMERDSGREVIRRWSAISSFADRKPVVITLDGASYRGVTAGLDENGFLKVQRDDGSLETVYTGSVREAH